MQAFEESSGQFCEVVLNVTAQIDSAYRCSTEQHKQVSTQLDPIIILIRPCFGKCETALWATINEWTLTVISQLQGSWFACTSYNVSCHSSHLSLTVL